MTALLEPIKLSACPICKRRVAVLYVSSGGRYYNPPRCAGCMLVCPSFEVGPEDFAKIKAAFLRFAIRRARRYHRKQRRSLAEAQ